MGSSSVPEDFLSPQAPANATVRRISFLNTDPPIPQYKDYNAVVIDNLLTEEECKQLLPIAEASTVKDTSGTPTWGRAMINTGGGGILATDQRKCGRIIVDTPGLADKLLARLMPFLKEEGVDHINNQPLVTGLEGRGKAYRLSRLNEKLRFLKYEGGEYFRPHWDSNYITLDEEEESFYTLHLYLNGDGEQDLEELMQVSKKAEIGPEASVNMNPDGKLLGGATSFSTSYKQGDGILRVFPKTGSALVFQQYHLLHAGDPVFRGVKYTLRTDMMYREVAMT
ncbi:uncharacterized protein NFIA_088200 [Aspergillus fischeri NRRL 181]|uniref:Prolyl 4-hydroxylase alpha subunit domain-containing protein n=1 Tax=Neosartorya fischeri (strain ATCC 1020 / DSM 3700 / CBS 544.65 / FGSC A1164 / JCM 1740 / NRRL 181 / WB 181) TaxID=331117 RepID=A1DHK7_NEOFI|nr:conserved hypothetical protein [Aspergillus fischeri NRRL 181]EAW18864.1 conserved hypothetical protein [Aspergillus fischeri NRRL 181]